MPAWTSSYYSESFESFVDLFDYCLRYSEMLVQLLLLCVGFIAWLALLVSVYYSNWSLPEMLPLTEQVYIFLWLVTEREPDLKRADSEKVYLVPGSGETRPFPSIDDPPSVYMTLVVPAYKEQDRCKD